MHWVLFPKIRALKTWCLVLLFQPQAAASWWGPGCNKLTSVIPHTFCRIGTAEVESALVAHAKCAEAAVVGYEHPIKGQGIYAYVTLMEGVEPSEDIRRELINTVRGIIGAFAAPDVIHWVSVCKDGS
jgi:non-ribosomal peptide synthetase component E (peptide arylation enzyme)